MVCCFQFYLKLKLGLTFVQLLFIIHVHLQQSDEHAGQDAQELQVGACLPHLEEPTHIVT